MGQTLLVIGVIIYFIKEQYSFTDVKKLNFLFIPLFSLFQFFKQMNFNNKLNIVWLGLIALVSLAIGFYQAKHSKVAEEKQIISYFEDVNGNEVPIYKKMVKSYGGTHYLIGWLFICLFQFLIENFLIKQQVTLDGSFKEMLDEIIKDIFGVYRLFDTEKQGWYVWALYGFSSLSYTYFLGKKYPKFQQKIFVKHPKVEG